MKTILAFALAVAFTASVSSQELPSTNAENTPRFISNPEEYDWQLAVFFHLDAPDEEGKTQRRVGYFNFDKKGDCEVRKQNIDVSPTPPHVVLDGTICLPWKKQSFDKQSSIPRLPNGKIDVNQISYILERSEE